MDFITLNSYIPIRGVMGGYIHFYKKNLSDSNYEDNNSVMF